MDKEILRNIIREGQEDIAAAEAELFNRPFEFEENGRYVMTGVRHAGKSYMLYQRALELIRDGHSLEEMLYINFDDERLYGVITSPELDDILQAYASMFPHKPILLLDEIQNIEGWEHFARRLANRKYRVLITGSNAKMLSKDMATVLGNRYLDEIVFPYSFQEYLGAKGIQPEENRRYGKNRDEIILAMKDYFDWGGFPELLLYNNKRKWLNQLYEKILLGDIVQRHKLKNEMAVRLTYKRLAETVKHPVAYNRIANLVKSTGVSTTPASVMDYVGFAKEAFLLFSLNNYASKFTEKETIKKHYFIDNGLLHIFLSDPETALLENICAIDLHTRYDEEQLWFWNRHVEVDFYLPDEKAGIQACYSTSKDLTTFSREIDALMALDKVHPLNKMVIVTYDEERILKTANGKEIEIVPLWKWLLR